MNAARARRPRGRDRQLLRVDEFGRISSHTHRDLPSLLRAGDLVVANDAATLPASLTGVHVPSGAAIEVRLAFRSGAALPATSENVMGRPGPPEPGFTAIVFGAGDYRTRTEDRPAPPTLRAGDALLIASLRARVVGINGHPRLIELEFEHSAAETWEGLARHGRPIQYAHVPQPLALWDTWTSIAARPVAFEAPSAGFLLDWSMLSDLRRRGVRFSTLTHAAGISSTGDPALDAHLPFDEPYVIPSSTAVLIELTKAEGGRVVAIGTTVVRALEHAARKDGHVAAGPGLATGRLGRDTRLRVVDAIVSGVHETDTSHYELLRAFQRDDVLARATVEAEAKDYLAHEFGDAVLIVRSGSGVTLVADEWPVASEMRQVERAVSAEPYLAAGAK